MALDPIIEGLLGAMAASGMPPIATLDPVAARSLVAAMRPDVAPKPVARVEELVIPVEGAEIGARLYADEMSDDLPVLVFFHGGALMFGDIRWLVELLEE